MEKFILEEEYHLSDWEEVGKFSDNEFDEFCKGGSLICNLYNMFFKLECFKGEKEYRVVFISAEDSDNLRLGKPKFRVRNGIIIPYYEYYQSNIKANIKQI